MTYQPPRIRSTRIRAVLFLISTPIACLLVNHNLIVDRWWYYYLWLVPVVEALLFSLMSEAIRRGVKMSYLDIQYGEHAVEEVRAASGENTVLNADTFSKFGSSTKV